MKENNSGKKKQSLKSVSLKILLPTILVLLAIGFFLYWGFQENRKLANQYIRDTGQLYVDQINKNIFQINSELIVLLNKSKDIAAIPASMGPREGKHYQLISDLKEQNNILKIRYDEVSNFFIYGQEADVYIDVVGTSFKNSAKSELNTIITGILYEETAKNSVVPQWRMIETSDDNYIIGWYAKNYKAIGCIMRIEDILLKMEDATESYKVIPFIEIGEGEILMSARSKRIYGEDFLTSGQYNGQIYSYQVGSLGPLLLYVLPNGGILEDLLIMQMLLAVFVFVLLIAFSVITYSYRRRILLPMKKFVEGLSEIDEEQMLNDDGKNNLMELEAANDKFKELLQKIQCLKIAAYEEELMRQKAELEYVQEQIKPHFFLNCLSLIHGIADVAKEKQILYITEILSDYIRYIFKDSGSERKFSDELEHVLLYIEIQKLRYGKDAFYFTEIIDEDIGNCPVPSLLLQTLVENAVVHALNLDKAIEISLYATFESYEDKQYLYICVSDTGQGFSKEILEAIENDENIIYNGRKHVGLQNIRQRLRLIYGKDASITFSNMDEQFGAVVEVRIPRNSAESSETAVI